MSSLGIPYFLRLSIVGSAAKAVLASGRIPQLCIVSVVVRSNLFKAPPFSPIALDIPPFRVDLPGRRRIDSKLWKLFGEAARDTEVHGWVGCWE